MKKKVRERINRFCFPLFFFITDPLFKKKLAMLDLLIAASMNDNKINDKEIQEEVDTFMFAVRVNIIA